MKQLIDFVPLVIFFVLFKTYDIYVGVAGLMVASSMALAVTGFLNKKIEKIALFTYLMIMVFGALTLYFRNSDFIKWKVTIIYLLFAFALAVSQFIFNKPLIQTLLGKELTLAKSVWNRINLMWILFFVACALSNLYVTYYMSEAFWATFKVFILPGVTLVFTIISGIYIYKNIDKSTHNKAV